MTELALGAEARLRWKRAEKRASKSRLFTQMCGLALLCLVLSLTLNDDVARPQLIAGQDKVEHLLAFLGLGFLFGWGASLWALFAAGIALGGAAFGIEALQDMLTTTREGAFSDAAASCLGLGLGLLGAFLLNTAVAWLVRRRRRTGG